MKLQDFTQMFSDKSCMNFTKLKYKFGEELLMGYVDGLKTTFWKQIALKDFRGEPIVFIPSKVNLSSQSSKALSSAYTSKGYGLKAMEDEIVATLSIEQIDTSKESVRNILSGAAPQNSNEYKAYGIKRGLDFIADSTNKITAENIFSLYSLSVGDFLKEEDKLLLGRKYRHDAVYIVGKEVAHQGLDHERLTDYMNHFIKWINEEDSLDQIIKSIIIHYYFAYIHPYFDGNGRMARLMQLWYLVQMGYTATLFLPFSAYINESKTLYYKAFNQISDNQKIVKSLDVTPFIVFFIEEVLVKLSNKAGPEKTVKEFEKILQEGDVTEKEKALFYFVLSAYGTNEFSTKKLEKDYKDVAYATVRSFVLKFEGKGLLSSQKYGGRVKYQVI